MSPTVIYDPETDNLFVELKESKNSKTYKFEDWLVEKRSKTGELLSIEILGFVNVIAEVQLERRLNENQKAYPPVLARMADALMAEFQRDKLGHLTELMEKYAVTPDKDRLPLARDLVKYLGKVMSLRKRGG